MNTCAVLEKTYRESIIGDNKKVAYILEVFENEVFRILDNLQQLDQNVNRVLDLVIQDSKS